MWVLAIHLPFIIGQFVPNDDQYWSCFLLLLKILKICAARITSVCLAHYLSILICDHNETFKACYPDASIRPKLHYMIHLPSQILK